MPRPGFVRDSLDVKLLVLYIMGRIAAPIDFATLTDLAMCDSGVDYFLFAQEVERLVELGHLVKDDGGLYSITEKGRTNGGIMESSLSPVVRNKCDHALSRINATLRRNAQITADVVEEPGGACRVDLGLRDDAGPILTLSLAAPSREQGQRIAQRFHDCPEECFNAILGILSRDTEES